MAADAISVLEYSPNPLLRGMVRVEARVSDYRNSARDFYFRVILSGLSCPTCEASLSIYRDGLVKCSRGHVFDPTLSFQRSACCGARLVKKTSRYFCGKCRQISPSRFAFDERGFDREYFREAMRKYREQARRRREQAARILAESRSADLFLDELFSLESLPGLVDDLNSFIDQAENHEFEAESAQPFSMARYRDHILSLLSWNSLLFSEITPVIEDLRKDRAYRFVTLVYMDHDRELGIFQDGDDILVSLNRE